MSVMTVLGPVEPASLGITLTHEHLLSALDWPGLWPSVSPDVKRVHESIHMGNLGLLRRDPYTFRTNLLLDDPGLIARELSEFRQAGGGAIVECSSIGLRTHPAPLVEIARATGLHVICGCGWYVARSHPPDVAEATVAQLAERITRELEVGIDHTDIRAGIIGEIGVSDPMHPNEEKVLRAAATAQLRTGAG